MPESARPRIAVASPEWLAPGSSCPQAVARAGGDPLVVSPRAERDLEALLSHVSGLCLTGWGELNRSQVTLAREADARELPILAISRGAHALNLARGGRLHRHLSDVVGEHINHGQEQPRTVPTHWVTMTPASRLHELVGLRRIKVNSFHQQGIGRLGDGLVATAHASDGTVESLEATDGRFVLAVQWHPEYLTERDEHAALFTGLVQAARGWTSRVARAA